MEQDTEVILLHKRDLFPASKEWDRMKAVPLQRAGAAGAAVELCRDEWSCFQGPPGNPASNSLGFLHCLSCSGVCPT